MDIRMITYVNIPCWYDLSWSDPALSLVLRIHKEFIDNKRIDFKKAPIVGHFVDTLKLPEFMDDFSKDIGFGGIFKFKQEKDDFFEYIISIPQVKKDTGHRCKECHGTGKSEEPYSNRKCLYCNGSGEEWIMDWGDIFAISATFTVLTTWLRYCEIDTHSPYAQLLTFNTMTREGLHGGSLSGDISIPMKKILESLGDRVELPLVSKAMVDAHSKMMGGLKPFEIYNSASYVENGRFIINCPGDATGLHPSDWYDDKDHGFEFSCHNVDTPTQQLTLLVGLAALHDIVKERII